MIIWMVITYYRAEQRHCLISFPDLSERAPKGRKKLFCKEWFNMLDLLSHKRVNQRLA